MKQELNNFVQYIRKVSFGLDDNLFNNNNVLFFHSCLILILNCWQFFKLSFELDELNSLQI